MKLKLLKYCATAIVIALSFWFYFQISTFPYKVARWFQPLEAEVVSVSTSRCSSPSSWLNILLGHAVTRQGAYSAQVAFIDADNFLESCVIGYKNKIFGVRVSEAHRYRYASVTKLITTAIIYDLVRQNKIRYEDTLISFFPEINQLKDSRIRNITVADLLNHRAGFNRLSGGGDPMFSRRKKPWCPHELAQLQTLALAFNPGEKQVYSNMGYCLLGAIVDRVTGEEFRTYAENRYSLSKYNIKFIDGYYLDDEVRYDYRYEEWYDDTYLKIFDFDSISAVAGLSGSANGLAALLWNIHHDSAGSPFEQTPPEAACKLLKTLGCSNMGFNYYRPEKSGIAIHYHEGYLPGVASVAIIDSFGGVTVLLKSGANLYQANSPNAWVPWIYNRLNLHYAMQGKLTILNQLTTVKP